MTSKQGAKSMGYEIPAITYPDSQKTDLKTLNGLKEQQQQEEETLANDLELRKWSKLKTLRQEQNQTD